LSRPPAPAAGDGGGDAGPPPPTSPSPSAAGDEDGDSGEEEDDDEDDGEDLVFDSGVILDETTSPHCLEFLYRAFWGCNPNYPAIQENIWMHSRVDWKEHNGAKAPRVTRRPTDLLQRFLKTFVPVHDARMAFTVYQHCNYLMYVLRQDDVGLVVVKVDTVSENDGEDWSKTAKIRRVMTTAHAIEQCHFKKDRGINLGSDELHKFQETLEEFQRVHKPWTVGCDVYHESDVVEDVDIRELIGVVRWYPFGSADAPEANHFKAPYDEYQTAELIYIGQPFQQTIRKARRSKA
jgi:hypothetical protein